MGSAVFQAQSDRVVSLDSIRGRTKPHHTRERLELQIIRRSLHDLESREALLGGLDRKDFANVPTKTLFAGLQHLWKEWKQSGATAPAPGFASLAFLIADSGLQSRVPLDYVKEGLAPSSEFPGEPEELAALLQEMAKRQETADRVLQAVDLIRDPWGDRQEASRVIQEASEAFQLQTEVQTLAYMGAAVQIDQQVQKELQALGGCISTGFPALDKHIGGWSPGDLGLVASHSGHGKTPLATQLAFFQAAQGRSTAIVSTELPLWRYHNRLVAGCSTEPSQYGINGLRVARIDKQRENPLNPWEEERYLRGVQRLNSVPLSLVTGLWSVEEIHAWARQEKKKNGLGCLVVDYPEGLGDQDPKTQERTAKGLRRLAVELNISVLAVAQYKSEAKDKTARPEDYWINFWKAWTKISSQVIHLWRPNKWDRNNLEQSRVAKLLITKRTQIPDTSFPGEPEVDLEFWGQFAWFREAAEQSWEG